MSKQSNQNSRPIASKKPQPDHQDALDMLVNWTQMAKNLGMDVETMFNANRNRLTIRVYQVAMQDGAPVIAAGEPTATAAGVGE